MNALSQLLLFFSYLICLGIASFYEFNLLGIFLSMGVMLLCIVIINETSEKKEKEKLE